ncbi:MAG TPA: non-homologous end-joining DNA ligase [Dermatophilaceae bacterium]|jgi:bifunctional non-homologous end joining protein LigD|nr:non-homologous end-joining DNA ligase [Dermatophilaceae bacterium]HPZ68523.1 non-homologous end-joining DNA ligase [Dermatophilaceae bacterium]HQD00895.1 non-homologous end-joining DNA ligase [Dermatophilaceae bacterium]
MPEPTDPAKVTVDAGGRRLVVSNLDKVIYPATETTKGEVLHYYARIAPVLLPHLAGRPVTRVRFPEGVEGLNFFEKNLPSGAPAWLPRVTLTHTSEPITYPMVTGLDALTYLANLASLEFHVPQWQIGADGLPAFPDRLVVDLDPGPGAGLQECSIVALLARERLRALGLDPIPVTSGSKGMQLYAALPGSHASADIALVARTLAQELTAAHPDLVVWKMTTSLRPGKVFFDWSQNVAAKTTISPYSLRGRPAPFVAAPRTWGEVQEGAVTPGALAQVTAAEVLDRVERLGDLAAAALPR